jgi:hypothetical protein
MMFMFLVPVEVREIYGGAAQVDPADVESSSA